MSIKCDPDWRVRESSRFTDGTYKPVPVNLCYPPDHFVHLSTTDPEPDQVAYTPSEAYGKADRQVRLRFGRYLKKVLPELSDAEIQAHVTAFKAALSIAESPATLHFATDRSTINDIFETEMSAHGSGDISCMCGKFDSWPVRPYHVYADSLDVAVAYVRSDGDIIARAVVSVKANKKEWVRLYARSEGGNDTNCGILRQLLGDAGYFQGDLYGCRLTKLETDSVMLPYIDCGGARVSDYGKYWLVVEDGGDYECNCTDGTAESVTPRCERCEREEDDCSCLYCDCCEESYPGGCDDCHNCPECDGCITHSSCSCARCTECSALISSDHYDNCTCTRCDDCGELEDDCECEDEEEDEEDEEKEEEPQTAVACALTQTEVELKLNRIYCYLRDAYGHNNVLSEYLLLRRVFELVREDRLVVAA